MQLATPRRSSRAAHADAAFESLQGAFDEDLTGIIGVSINNEVGITGLINLPALLRAT